MTGQLLLRSFDLHWEADVQEKGPYRWAEHLFLRHGRPLLFALLPAGTMFLKLVGGVYSSR